MMKKINLLFLSAVMSLFFTVTALAGTNDVHARDEDGYTALMLAIENRMVDDGIADTFIKAGADVNAESDGLTALMMAAEQGKILDMISLLKAGANANAKDFYGTTAMMLGLTHRYHSDIRVVSVLLGNGADVDAADNFGETALMNAVRYNLPPEVVAALLSAGANVNKKNNDGKTPLMLAALFNGQDEIVKRLLESGASVSERSNEGKTALDYAKGREKWMDSTEEIIALLW